MFVIYLEWATIKGTRTGYLMSEGNLVISKTLEEAINFCHELRHTGYTAVEVQKLTVARKIK